MPLILLTDLLGDFLYNGSRVVGSRIKNISTGVFFIVARQSRIEAKAAVDGRSYAPCSAR